MDPDRYPVLHQLFLDLTRVNAREHARTTQEARTPREGPGQQPDLVVAGERRRHVVAVPGVGDLSFTRSQREVVLYLYRVLASDPADPAVPEAVLIRLVGARVSKLVDLFRGHDAWGRLIVPGRRPATYRLHWPEPVAPPEEPDPDADITREPWDDSGD